MRRGVLVAGGVILALVVAGGVVAIRLVREDDLPRHEVARYLRAWEGFDGQAMSALVDPPTDGVAEAVTAMRDDLQVTKATFTAGRVRRQGDGAEAAFRARLELAGLGRWDYAGRLSLVHREEGEWRVRWTPSSLHPALAPGQRFGRSRSWAPRAPIQEADGSDIAASTDAVTVGLAPGRITDRDEVKTILRRELNVPPADVDAALDAPGVRPDFFVPVVQVPRARFEALRPVLEPVPGIFFRRSVTRVTPSEGFAAHVLGEVGEVTAERLGELGPPYLEGDVVGLSGLEGAFERELAGTPSGEVQVLDEAGSVVQVLHQFPGTPPRAVRTTLHRRVQQAAEQALAGVRQPAALVAVDASSGEVRAVVSRPLDEAFNRALVGRYPPGSTFKVVTTAAVLAEGTRPETPVNCPAQVSAGGREFVNFEGDARGSIPFRTAFAQSCNTAFVSLASSLSNDELGGAARTFGFGATYRLGLPVAGGQFPTPADTAERVAAAIGQGRVVASPSHMATVAAAVASGAWRPPRLLVDERPADPTPLDGDVAATIRGLMTEVVRSGTGTAAASSPGTPVAGKTGTAEFGAGDPPQTHAWFIGFRDSLAFAVLVEGGGVGGRVAAPLAARFLDGLRT